MQRGQIDDPKLSAALRTLELTVKRKLDGVLHGDHIAIKDQKGQTGAETFQHDVGGKGVMGRARQDEQRGEHPGQVSPNRSHAPGQQETEKSRQHPAREAGQDPESVIDAPDNLNPA